jgi:hypothetical protein
MSDLTGAQAACLLFARRKHDANTPPKSLANLSIKNDIRSPLRWNGQAGCLRSNRKSIFLLTLNNAPLRLITICSTKVNRQNHINRNSSQFSHR